MDKPIIIAIDGPAGSGKGTVAQRLADKLGFLFFGSGYLYRIVAFTLIEKYGEDFTPEQAREELEQINLRIGVKDGRAKFYVNGAKRDTELQANIISKNVAKVARVPEVREWVNTKTRETGREHSLIVEGRDTSTVIFPDADFKVFMDASLKERASRRFLQLRERGEQPGIEAIKKEISERDASDASDSFYQPDDAYYLNTDDLTIEEVVENLFQAYNSR